MINGSQEGIRWRLLVRPSYAVSYAQKFSNTPSNNYQPKKNTAEGVLRKKSIQRLRNCVEWLRLFSEPKYVWQKSKRKGYFFKLNFIASIEKTGPTTKKLAITPIIATTETTGRLVIRIIWMVCIIYPAARVSKSPPFVIARNICRVKLPI